MYTKKYAEYNSLLGRIMDEKDTLKLLISDEFGKNIPEKILNITPSQWAEYSFENNLPYIITYYKNDRPFVTVSITATSIGLSYFEEKNDKLHIIMGVYFMKGYFEKEYIPYNNNKVFLNQISKYGDLASTILFYSHKKKNNVFLEEFKEENGETLLVEQFGTTDLSKHWFDAPQNYIDYERFLDYQKMFDELPNLEY